MQNLSMSQPILGHQNNLRAYSEVFCALRWPRVLCAWSITILGRLHFSFNRDRGTHKHLCPARLLVYNSPFSNVKLGKWAGFKVIFEKKVSLSYPAATATMNFLSLYTTLRRDGPVWSASASSISVPSVSWSAASGSDPAAALASSSASVRHCLSRSQIHLANT